MSSMALEKTFTSLIKNKQNIILIMPSKCIWVALWESTSMYQGSTVFNNFEKCTIGCHQQQAIFNILKIGTVNSRICVLSLVWVICLQFPTGHRQPIKQWLEIYFTRVTLHTLPMFVLSKKQNKLAKCLELNTTVHLLDPSFDLLPN